MRRALKWIAILAFTAVALAAALAAVLSSGWFRQQVRARIIDEVQRASGGKAGLKRFDFDWRRLQATVEDFTLRGAESPGQDPLFQAARISLRLTVRSWLRRRIDLNELVILEPRFRIYVAPDGSTNLPHPPVPAAGTPVETLLKLKIGRLDIRGGLFLYDSRAVPFKLEANSISGELTYDSRLPAYAASLAAGSLSLPGLPPFAVETSAMLQRDRLTIGRTRLAHGDSWLVASGTVEDFRSPKVVLNWKAEAELREFPQWRLESGRAELEGAASYRPESSYEVIGIANVRGLGIRLPGAALSGVSAASLFRLRPESLELDSLRVRAFGGTVGGSAAIAGWRKLKVDGRAESIDLDRLRALVSRDPLPWNGLVSGAVSLTAGISPAGLQGAVLQADVKLSPAEGQLAIEGGIDATWTQQENRLELRPSTLRTAASSLSVEGVLGERLNAGLVTRNLRDLEAVLALASGREDLKIPAELENGEIRAEALVAGPLENPVLSGSLTAANASYSGVLFDHARGDFTLKSSSLELKNVEVRRQGSRTTGALRLALSGWQVTGQSTISASALLRQADLGVLLKTLQIDQPVSGRADAKVEVSGSLDEPDAKLHFDIAGAAFGREKFERLAGDVSYRNAAPGVFEGLIKAGSASLSFSGRYRRKAQAWDEGRLEVSLQAAGIRLADSEILASQERPLDGAVEAKLSGSVDVRPDGMALAALDGALSGRALTLSGHPLGDFVLNLKTDGPSVRAALSGSVDGRPFRGDGVLALSKGYPASLKVALPRLPFRFLHAISSLPSSTPAGPPPIMGFVEAGAEWSGSLEDPAAGKLLATIRRLQIRPTDTQILDTQMDAGDLTLRNSTPFTITIDARSARIEEARFEARDTDIRVKGSYAFGAKNPLDLVLGGSVNLAVLSSFKPDLQASGRAAIDARVRGAADDPNLSGRMTIDGAAFFLKDFPNGIENAKGAVYFERNRANIESLTGQTGGGAFQVTGFLGLSRGEISYRLAAKGNSIRVRYPEGVSTTLDADLTLTGSTKGSLLAGALTIQRSGFNPRTDFATAIAGSTNPIPTPVSQNEFLRNLLFDIRVKTSPNATFQTSYTQDLQTEADLRLRGSPAKPVLLGAVKVNQGMINFFGNRYTVSRGEILFYNTAAIVPSIDLDLETRIRGVIVYINVSGPLSRLNVNYRSEPPLQTNEILALLTVGRAPASTSSTAIASGGVRSPNVLETGMGGNTLLGGALSAGVSSRVERFFGASRIKIDPQLTGVDNIPQARLTIEQSLSRDITVTFVTNLSRSQQQVVRLEWDLSKVWSLVAVRDENGVFGVDFLFRKRFK